MNNKIATVIHIVYAIVLNYRKDDAIKILSKVAAMDIKLTSFEAETALALYRTGELFELHDVDK